MESTSFLHKVKQRRSKTWPLLFSERKLLLMGMDLVILNSAVVWLAVQSMPNLALSWSLLVERGYWFVLISGLWLSIGYIVGIYELAKAANAFRSVWSTSGMALVISAIYLLIPYWSPVLPGRRLIIFLFPLLAALGVGVWRWVYAALFVHNTFQQRALIVGAGESGRMLADVISHFSGEKGNPYEGTGYRVIGFVDDDPDKAQKWIADAPVLGSSVHLVQLVEQLRPYEIVVAIADWGKVQPQLLEALLSCRELGTPVTTMASLYETITGRVPVHFVGQNLNLILPTARPATFRIYLALRRLFDIVVAMHGCLFLGMLMPVIWAANYFTDRGDLFYRQARVGLGGRTFEIVKFRSMVMNAEAHTGAVWTEVNDPRITRVGALLRKVRLDEIPQFWNVLKGEMSLIGPRPERPHFVEQLAEVIPFYRTRHAVKPGITGWAQVKYQYGASIEDARTKLEYDLYYIKNQSAFLDLRILLKTVQVVCDFQGR